MNNKTSEIGAFIITLLLTVATMMLLIFTNLHFKYPPEGIENLLAVKDSIFVEELGGEEFVKLGNIPEPSESNRSEEAASDDNADNMNSEPQVDGDDLKDAGQESPAHPTPTTGKAPSPMKTNTTKPTIKPGAAKDNNRTNAKPAVKRATASSNSKAINNKMKNAFSAKGKTQGKTQGSPSGNSSDGTMQGHGVPGGGLVGYTVAYWGRPHSPYTGSVVVQVHVNARGKVTRARAISGTGHAWASQAVRRDCEKESLASAFSVPKNRTTEGIGTITWRFK